MMSDDEKLNNRLRMQKEIEKTIIDKIERPAREAIDALLAEAAERRARVSEIENTRRKWKEENRQQEKFLNVIFIIYFSVAGLFAVAAFLAFIKYLFW